MEICTEIIGNLHSPQWKDKELDIDFIPLDQWTAQKSRFLAKSERGIEYPIALKRQSQVVDGDIVFYDPEKKYAAVLKLDLNQVLVIDLSALEKESPQAIIRRSVELGHAIGNQHWPAVVKGAKIYVPLTVDKKVMLSVMDTHHLEGITYEFQPGNEVIPYMAPHEIRRLFGGASHENNHIHSHAPGMEHSHAGHGHGEHCHGEHAHGDHHHGHCHNGHGEHERNHEKHHGHGH